MRESLIKELQMISPEEEKYLRGDGNVKKDIYTFKHFFEIDKQLFLKEGRLITMRPHSRFVEFPEHSHNYIEMMYVCKGSITHVIEGEEIVMQKGDVLLLNQHVKHSVKRAEYDDVGINLIALPEFFDIPLRMLQGNNVLAHFLASTLRNNKKGADYLLFQVGEDWAIENLMENIIDSMLHEEQADDAITRHLMGLVFLYLMKHMEHLATNYSEQEDDVILQSLVSYIRLDYQTASLTAFAKGCNQSVSSLSKMIKRSTGFTFQELLQKVRFEKAIELLTETDEPIDAIITAVGYENQSYFYRRFKEIYGFTPRQYKKNNKKEN